jgi:predicted small lipoprotein YifL
VNSARRVHAAIVCATLTLGALLLGGCGQKGPLYLPDHNRSEVPVTPASSNTSPDPQKDPHNDTDKDAGKPAHRAP